MAPSFSRQFDQARVVEIRSRHVNEFSGLLLDGGDHFRMAVPRGHHGDSRGEIKERVSIDVFDDGAPAAPGHQRIAPRVGRGNKLPVEFNNASSIRTRQGRDQLRELGVVHGRGPRECVRGAHLTTILTVPGGKAEALQRDVSKSHLRFHTIPPSRVSSRMMPRSASCCRMRSEALKSRAFRAA